MFKFWDSTKIHTHRLNQWCFILLICSICLSGVFCSKEQGNAGDQWINLINDNSLQGWTIKFAGHELNDNYKNTFRIDGGVLKVCYDQYEQFDNKFGHIFYKDKFSHYILRAEYRFVGEQVAGAPEWAYRNNGLMLHSQSPQSMTLDQAFPISIEVQILGGNGKDDRPNGNLCLPGTDVVMDGILITDTCTNSNSGTFHGDQWVTVEAEVHGNDLIRHKVNGEVVMEYERPQLDAKDPVAQTLIKNGDKMLREGYIALQAESCPIEFRKLEILVLEE